MSNKKGLTRRQALNDATHAVKRDVTMQINKEKTTKGSARRYFSHDVGARNDEKMSELFFAMGYEGIGLYWCLIEMLYENNGRLKNNVERIAYTMRSTPDKVSRLVSDFGLFSRDDESFWSESVLRRIEQQESQINKAKAAAESRWGKKNAVALLPHTKNDASALHPHEFSNAINKEINKEINNSTAPDQISLFEHEPTIEPEVETEALPDLQFEKCWKLYEGHGVKKKAREYWAKLKPEQRNQIESIIPAYVASTSGPRKQYRKMFQGWINPANEIWTQPVVNNDSSSPKMKNGQWIDDKGMKRMILQ